MKKNKYRLINMLLSALFMSMGLVLPFFTGQIQQFGNMLLPMHLPVMLCGLICGWQYGFAIGLILPCFRFFLFGMPLIYPNAIAMSFELATYGLVIGIIFEKSKWKCVFSLYKALLISMISGRVVWGGAMWILTTFGCDFSFYAFLAGGFINAFPGIILQLILVPAIMLLLNRTHFVAIRSERLNNAK